MSLDTFYLKQLSDQDKALEQRQGKSNGATATIAKQSSETNQVLLTASDGSTVPAADNSSSRAKAGKSVAFELLGSKAQVNTKIGRA